LWQKKPLFVVMPVLSSVRFLVFVGLLLVMECLSLRVYAQAPPPPVYPRMAAYLGILHPIVTASRTGWDANFSDRYVVGFPIGINLWKTPKLGFSVEIVPTIRAENGTSRVANVLFHPGVLVNLGRDFTLASRLAFETSGRYGFTPVLNKIVKRTPTLSYFVAVPVPFRFGNDRPTSVTAGFQFGIVF
jgi:hypothetical protein